MFCGSAGSGDLEPQVWHQSLLLLSLFTAGEPSMACHRALAAASGGTHPMDTPTAGGRTFWQQCGILAPEPTRCAGSREKLYGTEAERANTLPSPTGWQMAEVTALPGQPSP